MENQEEVRGKVMEKYFPKPLETLGYTGFALYVQFANNHIYVLNPFKCISLKYVSHISCFFRYPAGGGSRDDSRCYAGPQGQPGRRGRRGRSRVSATYFITELCNFRRKLFRRNVKFLSAPP